MIRVFNHYVRVRTYLAAMVDFGLITLLMLGIFMTSAGHSSTGLALTATHGMPLAAVVTLAVLAAGLYRAVPASSAVALFGRVLLALLVAMVAVYHWVHAAGQGGNSAPLVAMLGVGAIVLNRALSSHLAGSVPSGTRLLIVGCGPQAAQAAKALKLADPRAKVVGYFSAEQEREIAVPAAEIVRETRSLADAAARFGATEIVVALSERRGGGMGVMLSELLECKVRGIRVCDISTHFERMLGQIRVDFVNPGWLVYGDGFDQGFFRATVKRIFDISAALILSIVAAPIMLLAMVLIALDSKGPVFYSQQRTGLNGRPFNVIKFRSMYTDAEKDGPRWAATADDRITRVGRFIRKVRIDELPQLFNVLRGEMSIVGPRPERPFFVDQLAEQIPYYNVRHSIKPGVTGWAQVRYHYGATVEDSLQKLQYDLYYVKNNTLFLDLVILAETAAVVLLGKGAR